MRFFAWGPHSTRILLAFLLAAAGADAQIFTTQTDHAVVKPRSLAVADFNNDGIQDLVATNSDPPPCEYYRQQTVSLLLGRDGGDFHAPHLLPVGTFIPEKATAADFNGDGNADVLAAAYQVYAGCAVLENYGVLLLGNGDGTFQERQSIHQTEFLYWVPVGRNASAVGDLNADSLQDILAGRVFLGNGDGTFSPGQALVLGYPIEPGDWNGDGSTDFASIQFNDGAYWLALYRGRGDASFQEPVLSPAEYSTELSPGDFDHDGNLDLVLALQSSPSVGVLLGRGDGTFGPLTRYPAGLVPFNLAASDFNGDGALDLAAGQAGLGTVTVLLGRGDGSFREPIAHEVGDIVADLLAVDWNDDSRPDLTVSSAADRITILWNGVGIAFNPASATSITIPAGQSATYVLQIGGGGVDGVAALSCSGVPLLAACSVPASVTFDAVTRTPISVTVTTTPPGSSAHGFPFDTSVWPIFAIVAVARMGGRLRRGCRMALLFALLAMSACGGGSTPAAPPTAAPGTPPGTYQLQVTATTATQTQSVSLTLVVQ